MSTLLEIDAMVGQFSSSKDVLSDRLRNLEDEVESIKRRLLPGIKSAMINMETHRKQLRDSIVESPEVFQSPKTLILHGIKVGFKKGGIEVNWESDEHVCALIRKHLPEQADVLIRVVEKPLKNPIKQLSVQECRKISVTMTDVGDVVVIKPVAGDVDKLVKKWLVVAEKNDQEDAESETA